jgi:hypothetical protein
VKRLYCGVEWREDIIPLKALLMDGVMDLLDSERILCPTSELDGVSVMLWRS